MKKKKTKDKRERLLGEKEWWVYIDKQRGEEEEETKMVTII